MSEISNSARAISNSADPTAAPANDSLAIFSEPVRSWFTRSFESPTPPQVQGWPAIASGEHTLVLAPTGTGKTLSAFLWGIDRLIREPTEPDDPRTRIVYISPLKALAVDIDKNLRGPLSGIVDAAKSSGSDEQLVGPTVAVRTGDTSAKERRRIARYPPDILITTPESLYLMLTSQAREGLRRVEAIIIDEIHALAGTKRGAHLSLSLERLSAICGSPPQRIGLSATQRPLEETARFLGGRNSNAWRPVTIVDAGIRKDLEIEVVVPTPVLASPAPASPPHEAAEPVSGPPGKRIWPAIHPRLLDLIQTHTSTLVFVNNRRLAERLANQLNELAHEQLGPRHDDAEPQILVKAHHGSISRDQRTVIENELKSGSLKGLIATSSLELGIDMGALDLVVLVESPGAVSRGLQRIGRAGHNVGDVSKGKLFPKHRADLLESTVVAHRMRRGLIESTHFLRNPVDVLAQQIVAMCAMDDWSVEDLADVVHGSANFADLTSDVLLGVIDLLAGRYPSEQFAALAPRIVWDRVANELRGRRGAQRLAVTNPGTIPDRGLFGVFLPDGTRVGELDEEMVYESRPGEVFVLGASSWRIEEITFERVVVTPASGVAGKMPFWRGDGPGRPLELGQAIGEFVRELRRSRDPVGYLTGEAGLDSTAATSLVDYLDEQAAVTGVVPDDRTVVVERFRDELGDWRVCLHTPFGAQVHAPWAMAIRARAKETTGTDIEMIWSDDGIVMRLPEHLEELPSDWFLFDESTIDQIVIDELPHTALFASRFREAAGRALLLPKRRPDQRTPLWQQRQRAADLLTAAKDYPEFPILLETVRECLNDVFDLPALRQVLAGIAGQSTRLVHVDTPRASPFAQSLLFGWIAVYMYEGDAPLAERRAAALALDRDLLAELLGAEQLRELLDADVMAEIEARLQRLVEDRAARDPDELHDVLRQLGPQSMAEIQARIVDASLAQVWVDELVEGHRAFITEIAGHSRVVAAQDATRVRDALGSTVAPGLPDGLLGATERPLRDLVERYARTHAPFLAEEVAARYGAKLEDVLVALEELETQGRLSHGEFRPQGTKREWCDNEVLRQLRRRSLAALRKEIEPVDANALGRFLPSWQGVGLERRGVDGLVDALSMLQGAPIAASVLENDVLAVRVADYSPSLLDNLCTSGDLIWIGAGSIGRNDGRIRLFFRDQAALLAQPTSTQPQPGDESTPDQEAAKIQQAIRDRLTARGASFWPDLVSACAEAGLSYRDDDVLNALWELVWSGEVTNDSLAPVRAFLSSGAPAPKAGAPSPRGRDRRRPRPGRVSATGPPSATGRWSMVEPLLAPTPSSTAVAHARASQLLERFGVLTREAALGEGNHGGFAGVYPVLRALEDQGKVRRGYFVSGLGAAQFALPGAIDRLRTLRDQHRAVVLAATDPAQPYGAALPWPSTESRPSRSTGAYVVIEDGRPLIFVERGGGSLIAFADAAVNSNWAHALAQADADGRVRLEITKINAEPARDSPLTAHLEAAGFTRGYRGWVRSQHTKPTNRQR